jgi:hypothetical protein
VGVLGTQHEIGHSEPHLQRAAERSPAQQHQVLAAAHPERCQPVIEHLARLHVEHPAPVAGAELFEGRFSGRRGAMRSGGSKRASAHENNLH